MIKTYTLGDFGRRDSTLLQREILTAADFVLTLREPLPVGEAEELPYDVSWKLWQETIKGDL